MRTLLYFLFLSVLTAVCPTQLPAYVANETGAAANRAAGFRTVSPFENVNRSNSGPLELSRVRLQLFAHLLEQKLSGADRETKTAFNPVRQQIADIAASPAAVLLAEDDTSLQIESLLAEISRDPVLALVYEESMRLPTRPVLATIRPDRGHGAVYNSNESIRFTLNAARDCYVQVLFLAPKTAQQPEKLRPQVLYPDNGKATGRLKAGETVILGAKGEFSVQPPYGTDLILVVASENELPRPFSTEDAFVSMPLRFDRLFADIYGEKTADVLSLHSSFFVSRPSQTTETGGVLLTEEEAAILRLDDDSWVSPPLRYRSMPAGPVIRVHEPSFADEKNPIIKAFTPMDLKITFEQNKAPVDMESLEVTARKGFISMSITKRVKEYLTGTMLDARKLDFPEGKFLIQVEIADVEGIVTAREYHLEVRGK